MAWTATPPRIQRFENSPTRQTERVSERQLNR